MVRKKTAKFNKIIFSDLKRRPYAPTSIGCFILILGKSGVVEERMQIAQVVTRYLFVDVEQLTTKLF